MSIDIAREALHRIAREMEIATALDPQVIATTIIQRVQRIDAQTKQLTTDVVKANRRLETLQGVNVDLKGLINMNQTLNEIARLRKQRRILAFHLRKTIHGFRFSRSLVRRFTEETVDLRSAVLRVSEMRDHAISELASEKQASRASLDAMQADLDAARAEAHELDAKWRDALQAQCQAVVERDEASTRLRALETSNG